jgi:hypothetical protein
VPAWATTAWPAGFYFAYYPLGGFLGSVVLGQVFDHLG